MLNYQRVAIFWEHDSKKVYNGELRQLGNDMMINPTMMRISSQYLRKLLSVIQCHYPKSQCVIGKMSIHVQVSMAILNY